MPSGLSCQPASQGGGPVSNFFFQLAYGTDPVCTVAVRLVPFIASSRIVLFCASGPFCLCTEVGGTWWDPPPRPMFRQCVSLTQGGGVSSTRVDVGTGATSAHVATQEKRSPRHGRPSWVTPLLSSSLTQRSWRLRPTTMPSDFSRSFASIARLVRHVMARSGAGPPFLLSMRNNNIQISISVLICHILCRIIYLTFQN